MSLNAGNAGQAYPVCRCGHRYDHHGRIGASSTPDACHRCSCTRYTPDVAPTLELELVSYRKPALELYDFQFRAEPVLDAGELVGIALELAHPSWPASVRMMLGRLEAVELGTGLLALVDSHESPKGGD
jgi:hypothetical protein